MPTILDSLFHKVGNTTSSPIGVGVGSGGSHEVAGSHEVVGPSDSKKFIWPNGVNSGCFQLYTSQNVATSMPNLTSQSCGDSLLTVCLAGKLEPFTGLWTSDRPVNEASVKVDHYIFGNDISMNC